MVVCQGSCYILWSPLGIWFPESTFLKPFFKWNHLPRLWYCSCSPWFFESGKRWSYNHRESPSEDTGLWKVLFGNGILLKSTGLLHLHLKGHSFWRMNELALALTNPLLAWSGSLLIQGLGRAPDPSPWLPWRLENRPDLRSLRILDQGVMFSPSSFFIS